ncbi:MULTISPECIES: hypothetical protein [unclassified Streptomyces]|uniref:hypothetical protein n=1 Tax=unclassified Streptomyces TaxID=2593676 RepID=UPI001BEAD41F|nr:MULTISPECIES: hypothetical protein [unclassified Streptomyces]MBT2406587.1 hypothetical protein [Streptomyces sp. ISL-21]MBT2458055.1 hypothetical protein [Streptomyces sp. ISL-86]MBT2608925.1 hypothetical protein [Streptomyces sp. ISL-87]
MHIDGAGRQQRGHVLLVAGDAAVRRRAVQVAPSANLAALGVVPPELLLNSQVPSDTTYLDGARDPNTVLMRLRAAAATPGPLLVYLSGRLTLDRRGRHLHLALAGTAASSVRYTALPWEWLGTELRSRPAGLTTVVLDLVADKPAWPVLQEYGGLPASSSAEVYGVVLPPAFAGGGNTVSSYTRQWIDQLRRSPTRPANLHLHAFSVGAAALPPGTIILPATRELAAPTTAGRAASPSPAPAPAPAVTPGPAAPGPVTPGPAAPPPQDPRPHIHALAATGRHGEAATLAQAWEQHVLQTHGCTSPEATHWAEIRADLARMAGNYRSATQLWINVGRSRLSQQPPDSPEVLAAAAGALYCWTQLKDRAAARDAGPELIRLLRALPSLEPRLLRLSQQRLEFLNGMVAQR